MPLSVVTSINVGEAIANGGLAANGIRLVASITVEAARELGLAEGSNVTAVIKASDVMLATVGCFRPHSPISCTDCVRGRRPVPPVRRPPGSGGTRLSAR